jgi:hypothetical protein
MENTASTKYLMTKKVLYVMIAQFVLTFFYYKHFWKESGALGPAAPPEIHLATENKQLIFTGL